MGRRMRQATLTVLMSQRKVGKPLGKDNKKVGSQTVQVHTVHLIGS